MNPEFSIILPVYNQASHLAFIIEEYSRALNMEGLTYEVILVVNGSTDSSYDTAISLTKDLVYFRVFNLEKGGWGRAVKYGVLQAAGEFICYTNSARTNPEDLVLMLKYARVNNETVIKANRIVRDNFLRRFGSVLYNFQNRFLFRLPIWDVNGTPKVFPAQLIKNMNVVSDGDLIDAEVMAICFRNRIPVIEVPVRINKRLSGKSTTGLWSAVKMYYGLLLLRGKV